MPGVVTRKFCVACREMLEEGEFSRSGLMCDWCCRHCEVTPPPRCPSCGIMYKTQHEAEICCTEEGWKDK